MKRLKKNLMRKFLSVMTRIKGYGFFLTVSLCSVLLFMGHSVACGVNSHLWITDSAICQLPMATSARSLYEDQRRVDLTRLGSAFPDSGYAIDHAYGEIAHWPPFVQAFIESFQSRHGVVEESWSEEALDEAAFIMGVAAHGYEDELFDTQFLRWVSQEDGEGQEIIDPALDVLLIFEGHTELFPALSFPVEATVDAIARTGISVNSSDVESGLGRVHQFALGLTRVPSALAQLVERDAPFIPWAARHYLDRNITGSLAHEPVKVAALLEAVYHRLAGHEVAASVLSHVDPSPPMSLDRQGVLRGDESQWISLYFHTAVETETTLSSIKLMGNDGQEIPYHSRSTRWGGDGFTRIIQLSPLDLTEVSAITLEIEAGIPLFNGETTVSGSTYPILICDDNRCEYEPTEELLWGGEQRGCHVIETLEDMGVDESLVGDMKQESTDANGLEESNRFDQTHRDDTSPSDAVDSEPKPLSSLDDDTSSTSRESAVGATGCSLFNISHLAQRHNMTAFLDSSTSLQLMIVLALVRIYTHLRLRSSPLIHREP